MVTEESNVDDKNTAEQRSVIDRMVPYLRHRQDCQLWRPIIGCDCGLEDLLNELNAIKKD